MQAILNGSIHLDSSKQSTSQMTLAPTDDYADVLRHFGLKYRRTDYYLEVGEPSWIQGWIFDISVVQTQLMSIQEIMLPFLIQKKLVFKIARSIRKAHSIISGELGWLLLGKVLTIYPPDQTNLSELAGELIQLTRNFKGPEIPTDFKLGAVLYARYGAGKAIIRVDEAGLEEKYIYDPAGNLVKETQTSPCQLPQGIEWPFSAISPHKAPSRNSTLQDRYKPMYMLKDDPKGSVRKGLWLKKFYQIKWCVIKEGKQNMVCDLDNRDMFDRLRWQNELHRDLQGIVPLPIIYDLFEENGNGYLVMEYIKGVSLRRMIEQEFASNTWGNLRVTARKRLIGYAIQVLKIIEAMHKRGYIHRDCTTNNFIVRKGDQLCMIDLELSYSLGLKKPFPPFRLGTPGFMSPEQDATLTPTVEQDIYAIGAVLAEVLTGLSPNCIVQEENVTKQQLRFFIKEDKLVNLIGNCFSINPAIRPSIPTLRIQIEEFLKQQTDDIDSSPKVMRVDPPASDVLETFIVQSLEGLASEAMVNANKLWVTKVSGADGSDPNEAKPVAVEANLFQGVGGVLCLLARANMLGFPLSACTESYEESMLFIRKNSHGPARKIQGGLFWGSAGLAMSMLESARSGLIADNDESKEDLLNWLSNKDLRECGIGKGLAGKGMVLLQATSSMVSKIAKPMLSEIVNQLIALQQQDGSWTTRTDKNRIVIKPTGFDHGVAGIACFLLCHLKICGDNIVIRQSAIKAMQWLVTQAYKKRGIIRWPLNNKSSQSSFSFKDGCMGILLALVKAYEVLDDVQYRDLAEDCLKNYNPEMINWDLTQATGLAGYGEVLLEGARIFRRENWQERADWIAQYLLHYFKQENGKRYWLTDASTFPTAGLMLGNSGIIHFLLRYHQPGKLSHPLLSC